MDITDLTGFIMSRDEPVARIEKGRVIEFKINAPLHVVNNCGMEAWLKSREIDEHRTNSRLLKRIFRLSQNDNIGAIMKFNAASITDNYWFRFDGEEKSFKDVCFSRNIFDKLALSGDPDAFSYEPEKTPEFTNIGSFEKCWTLHDGEWWLYKKENREEAFSELFVDAFCKKVGYPTAGYEMCDGFVRTKDFTNGRVVNAEPIDAITNGDDSYEKCFNALSKLGKKSLLDDYIRIILTDSVCFNMDRHSFNIELLRNPDTGEIVSLAPNYDNNIALIARGIPSDLSRDNDGLIRFLKEFLMENPEAAGIAKDVIFDPVGKDDIMSMILNIDPSIMDPEKIADFVVNGEKRVFSIVEIAFEHALDLNARDHGDGSHEDL